MGWRPRWFDLGHMPDRDAVVVGYVRNTIAQQNGAWAHLIFDPFKEGGRGLLIHRHDDYALDEASPERGDPARPVFGPDHDGIAFVDGFGAKADSEGRGHLSHVLIAV